jgi:hypothetical protein
MADAECRVLGLGLELALPFPARSTGISVQQSVSSTQLFVTLPYAYL